jgi:cell division protein FtsQ
VSDPSGAEPAKKPRRRKTVVAPEEEPPLDDSGPEARRGLGWALGVIKTACYLVVLAAAVGGFAYGANHFFVTTERFGIEQVEAEGSRRFSDEQLLSLAGVARGDNLFALDLEEAERRLSGNPWIATARITRKIPDTLTIRVTEHVAAALASIDSTLYLVTRDGLPIKALEPGESSDYAIVTGVDAEALRLDRERALERVAAGVGVLARYHRLPLSKGYPAQEVNMAEDGNISLVVGNSGITFHLGKGPVRQKLLMAARVLARVRARKQTPTIVFLDNEAHPERVVVRLR